jgi:hypothetical protein
MNSLKFPSQENGPLSKANIRKRAAQMEADNRKRAALYDPSIRPSQQRRLEHDVLPRFDYSLSCTRLTSLEKHNNTLAQVLTSREMMSPKPEVPMMLLCSLDLLLLWVHAVCPLSSTVVEVNMQLPTLIGILLTLS